MRMSRAGADRFTEPGVARRDSFEGPTESVTDQRAEQGAMDSIGDGHRPTTMAALDTIPRRAELEEEMAQRCVHRHPGATMTQLILKTLIIDQANDVAMKVMKIQSDLEGMRCEMDGEAFTLTQRNGDIVEVSDVALNEERGETRVIRGTAFGLDLGFLFEPTDQETLPLTIMGRAKKSTKAERDVVGRWVPKLVDYLPVEEGEDDGGFSDEGFGETMDAADLMDPSDYVEFLADGTAKAQYWGSSQEGTWKKAKGGLAVTFWGTETVWPVLDNGHRLVRPDMDEEHGRAYEVIYEPA